MSKEIPILFTGPMVTALLAQRKGVTRRLTGLEKINENPGRWTLNPKKWMNSDGQLAAMFTDYEADETIMIKCPYGDVGDLLWVRESFRKYFHIDEHGYTNFNDQRFDFAADNVEPIYEMDGDGCQVFNKDGSEKFIPFKSPIFMPKKISRIWLQNTAIIVDQLHEITQEEAIKEGIEFDWSEGQQFKNYENDQFEFGDSRDSFKSLWIKMHGLESWNKNPYVWAPSFTILSTTGKPHRVNPSRSVAMNQQSETK